MNRTSKFLFAALTCALFASTAQAQGCPSFRDTVRSTGFDVNLRFDNDLFGGEEQDQGYSHGFLFTAVSPNLVTLADDPCLPSHAILLNNYLDWLRPSGFEEQNMTFGFGQVIFTPSDWRRTDLIENDRPYSAALLVSAGYNARSGDLLRSAQLRLGLVGPSALGKQIQNGWHKIIGEDRFGGWENQLRNELVIQFIQERSQRLASRRLQGGWQWDVISHYGGSIGNFATYANVGGEWRFGRGIPSDFGTAPLRPAGENTSPVRPADKAPGLAGHVFVAFDARLVLRDISLDGNTFATSHSVDKRHLVGDVAYGVALTLDNWRFAIARYHRTREFSGQQQRPVYGTFAVSRRF